MKYDVWSPMVWRAFLVKFAGFYRQKFHSYNFFTSKVIFFSKTKHENPMNSRCLGVVIHKLFQGVGREILLVLGEECHLAKKLWKWRMGWDESDLCESDGWKTYWLRWGCLWGWYKNIDKTRCWRCWPCSLLAPCLEFDISPHLEFVLVVVVVIGGQRNASLEFPFQLGKGAFLLAGYHMPWWSLMLMPHKNPNQNPHLNHRSTANDPACWEHQPFVASCQGKTRRFPCLFYGGGRHESSDSPSESSGKNPLDHGIFPLQKVKAAGHLCWPEIIIFIQPSKF